MVERWWLASRMAALAHLFATVALMVGNVVQVIRSAVDSSRDLHGYVFLFSALFAVILVIPLLILVAARALIRRRRPAGLVLLGVCAAVAVVMTVGTRSAGAVAAVATVGVSTLVIVIGTGISSRSKQQRSTLSA